MTGRGELVNSKKNILIYYNRFKIKFKLFQTLFIKKTRKYKKEITKQIILNDLSKAGINKGDNLLVHSSLSKIGNVSGGPNTIINSLLDTIGPEGNLVMPAYSYLGSMKETLQNEDFVFNPEINPSVVGIITETFRKWVNIKRSIHPTHSVCAYGPKADYITSGHLLAETNFGINTPFHRIRELKGKIVGLGIGIGPVTIYHSIEDFFPEFFKGIYLEKSESFKILVNGEVSFKNVQIHNPAFHISRIDKNLKIENWMASHLRKKNILHENFFGSSTIWWMDIQELFDELLILKKKGISIYNVPEKNED